MKAILDKLTNDQSLSKEEAKQTLIGVAAGDYNASQIAAFLTVYMMRTVRVHELEGFRDALLELCVKVDLNDFDPIDLCGTGGDGKDTFNISTLASFVTAGSGIKVAKHGNYGVSSACGSSNVLEYLGVQFTNDQNVIKRNIEAAGICFLHAPLFHPAMKNVAPIRKELGMKTFFNMLGPMVNPSFPNKQLVGVFNLELARIYAYLYQKSNKNFVIIHELDGYDEVSLTSECKMISNTAEKLISPRDIGILPITKDQIYGGNDVPSAARIFTSILNGEGTEAQNNVVCANAGLAIQCYYPEVELIDAFKIAEESLKSKKALECFKKLIE